MKTLTIHQPYSHLIVTPPDELPPGAVSKRVENRTWGTQYRGELAIHAGVSLSLFRHGDWPLTDEQSCRKLRASDFPQMPFGAVVGVCDLVAVLDYVDIQSGNVPDEFKWLRLHPHACGPKCFVLDNIRRLACPLMATGKQGFWTLDPEVESHVRSQLGKAYEP